MLKKVHCPTCQKEVVWSPESIFRPFCSERCRLIDLGAWADDSYSIPTTESPEDNSDDDSSSQNIKDSEH